MRNLFNIEAPITQTLTKFSWLLWYSTLWVFCCLPVITIGASTAALYRMVFRMHEEGDYSTKAFFEAFREEFRPATVLWLIILVFAVLLVVFYLAVLLVEDQTAKTTMLAPFCFGFVLWGFVVLYGFPLNCFFENSVGNTLKNALAMSIKNLRQSIYCFALAVIPFLALMISVEWFFRLLYLWVFFYPGLVAYWISGILKKVFLQYVPQVHCEKEEET